MLYYKKLNQLVSNGLNYVYDGRADPEPDAATEPDAEHGAADADAEHGAAETEAEHEAAEATDAEHEELKCEFNLSFSYPTRIPFETNFLTQKS